MNAAARPLIDYNPPLRIAIRRARLQRIRNAVIDIALAIAVAAFIFGAHNIVRAVDEYAITSERNAIIAAEVDELRARVTESEAWDCRDFGRTYDGRRHKWCSKEIRQ